MKNTIGWLSKNTKIAYFVNHEGTLDGQLMKATAEELEADLSHLRKLAMDNQLDEVAPRFRGEVRRMMLLLPPDSLISRMSMHEMREVQTKIGEIKGLMSRYKAKRPWQE